jgi:hypothetical protein
MAACGAVGRGFKSLWARFNIGAFKGILLIIWCKKIVVENQINNNCKEQDTWSLYLYALKSPVTRQKYQKRLEKFFDFLGMEGSTVEDKSKSFIDRMQFEDEINKNKQWVFNSLIKFMQFHLERVNRKEITGATVRNYVKSALLHDSLVSKCI